MLCQQTLQPQQGLLINCPTHSTSPSLPAYQDSLNNNNPSSPRVLERVCLLSTPPADSGDFDPQELPVPERASSSSAPSPTASFPWTAIQPLFQIKNKCGTYKDRLSHSNGNEKNFVHPLQSSIVSKNCHCFFLGPTSSIYCEHLPWLIQFSWQRPYV